MGFFGKVGEGSPKFLGQNEEARQQFSIVDGALDSFVRKFRNRNYSPISV